LLDRAGLTVRQILLHDVLIFGARCEKLPIPCALILEMGTMSTAEAAE
jgi:hypothetical protein